MRNFSLKTYIVYTIQCSSAVVQFIILYVGILLGYNLTETNDVTNQDDLYVNRSSLKELIKYVRMSVVAILFYESFCLLLFCR